MSRRDDTLFYTLYVDGQKTAIELAGSNKTEAYEQQLEDQWRLYFPDIPTPKRYRCKLVYLERWMAG